MRILMRSTKVEFVSTFRRVLDDVLTILVPTAHMSLRSCQTIVAEFG